MSSDGKFGPSDGCTRYNDCACYSKEEDYEYCYDTDAYSDPATTYCANRGARGSTLALSYLAGNFTSISPTPTKIPTAIPTIKAVIVGDFNGDNTVNLADFGEWKKRYLATPPTMTLVEFGVWKRGYLK